MKLSENTISILKNCALINEGIQIKPGSTIRTISKMKNVLAKATIDETFDNEIVLYDLNRFLGLVGMLKDPEIEVDATDKILNVKSTSTNSKIRLSDVSMIIAPPEKDIDLVSPEVEFQLKQNDLNQVVRSSSVLGLPNIAVIGDRQDIYLATLDQKDTNSDEFKIKVGKTDAEFVFYFVTENLKLIPGDYNVSITTKGFSHFKNTNGKIEYWLANESGSEFSE